MRTIEAKGTDECDGECSNCGAKNIWSHDCPANFLLNTRECSAPEPIVNDCPCERDDRWCYE